MLLARPGGLPGADNDGMPELPVPNRTVTSCLALAAALVLGGCVVPPTHDHRYESDEVVYGPTTSVYVRMAPPAPRVEYRGYAPAGGYVWIDGYWNWGGVSYLWVPGRWLAPRPGYVWVPHRWGRDGDRWRSDGGRWEPDRRGPPPRREWEREPSRPREHDRPREVPPAPSPPVQQPPPPRLESRPQAWPNRLHPREEQRQEARPEVQHRAEPEPEQRARGVYPRNGRDQRDPRDQHRPDHRGKDEDWRKNKDSDH